MRRIRLASLLATDSTGFTFLPKGSALCQPIMSPDDYSSMRLHGRL
jgi:hypothetical protein